MKAEEIMKEIEIMDNAERIKLLEMLYEKHFDSRPIGMRIYNEIEEEE